MCEYTGILARAEDMDSVLENNYIFEIDCLQTIKGLGGREVLNPMKNLVTFFFVCCFSLMQRTFVLSRGQC